MSQPVVACKVGNSVPSLSPLPAGIHTVPTLLPVPLLSLPTHASCSLSLRSPLLWFVFLSSPLTFAVELLPFYLVSPGFSRARGICVFRFFKEQGFQSSSSGSEAESLSWDACSTGKCNFCSHYSDLGWKDSLCPCRLQARSSMPPSLLPAQRTPGIMKAQGHWN